MQFQGLNTESSNACSPRFALMSEFSFPQGVSPALKQEPDLPLSFGIQDASPAPDNNVVDEAHINCKCDEPIVTPFCSATPAADNQSRWNAADDYLTDNESIPSSAYSPAKSVHRIRFFDSTASLKNPDDQYPLVMIKAALNPKVMGKKKRKQEQRNRKQSLAEKTKHLQISRTPVDSLNVFECMECKAGFSTGQALGGHMSKKHPGKSEHYSKKKQIRDRRVLERAKLLLAKKRYCSEVGRNYEELIRSEEGKEAIKKLLDRSKIRLIKKGINDSDAMRHVNPLDISSLEL